MTRFLAQRLQLTEEGRDARRSLMKREKRTEPRPDPCGGPRRTHKNATFVILQNHSSAPVSKNRLSPSHKARRDASHNKLVKESEILDRAKGFREIDRSYSRLITWLWFVKPI